MALVLALKENESFLIGERKFTVKEIYSPTRVKIINHGPFDEEMTLVSSMSTEIYPEVLVEIGGNSTPHSVRLSFDAPFRIKINREELLRNGKTV